MRAKMRGIGVFLCTAAVSGNLLAGCASKSEDPAKTASKSCAFLGPKAGVGVLAGAVGGAGALAAATKGNEYATIVGGVLGAIVGLTVGKNLDVRDCETAKLALRKLDQTPTDHMIAWAGPSGLHGMIIPRTDLTTAPDGRSCRTVERDLITKDGQQSEETGIVCRTPDGDYEPMG